jgi:hypothetical protein
LVLASFRLFNRSIRDKVVSVFVRFRAPLHAERRDSAIIVLLIHGYSNVEIQQCIQRYSCTLI